MNPTAAQLLKRSLDTFLAKNMKGWADLCAEDVVVEFPFAPDAASRRIIGRAAIYEYLRNYPSFIDIKTMPTLVIHETRDPDIAIAEWSVSGRVISTGEPYEMSYATFVTFRTGSSSTTASTGIRWHSWRPWMVLNFEASARNRVVFAPQYQEYLNLN